MGKEGGVPYNVIGFASTKCLADILLALQNASSALLALQNGRRSCKAQVSSGREFCQGEKCPG